MADTHLDNPQNPYLSFVVSASAGAGKTYQLSQRYLRLVAAGAEPAEILTVTFTRKAAAEMKERIIKSALELLTDASHAHDVDAEMQSYFAAARATNPNLRPPRTMQEAAASILRFSQSLKIQTIDSLFQELVQRFPVEAGDHIPIPFAIASSIETNEFERRAFLRLFEAAEREDAALRQTLQAYLELPDTGIRRLQDDLRAIYANHLFLWRTRPAAMPGDDRFTFAKPQALAHYADEEIPELLCDLLKKIAGQVKGKTGGSILDAADVFAQTAEPHCLRGSVFKKDSWAIQATIEKKCEPEDLTSLLLLVYELERHKLNRQGKMLLSLYEAFDTFLLEEKKQQHLVAYDDVTIGAHNLFFAGESFGALYHLFLRVSHLLVDEFQDTSRIQWDIFSAMAAELLSGEGLAVEKGIQPTVFLVGDAKQSIYAFRQGDYRLLGEASQELNERYGVRPVHLEENWRSSRFMIENVNEVFKREAFKALLPDFYPHRAAQHNGEWHIPDGGSLTLLKPVPVERGKTEAAKEIEAGQLVQLIRHWRENGLPVYDEDMRCFRPLRLGDIGILYRRRDRASVLERVLIREGIHYIREERAGYYRRQEISDAFAFLNFLANPLDDTALATLLRSPVLRFPDAALMGLLQKRQESPQSSPPALFTLLEQEHPQTHTLLRNCLSRIGAWSIDRIVLHFFEATRAFAGYRQAWGEAEGRLAEANLLQMVETLGTQTPRATGTIQEYLELLKDYRGVDETGNAQLAADAISLMTMHKAKGLEFPVVVLLGAEEGLRSAGGRNKHGFLKSMTGEKPFLYVGHNKAERLPEIDEYAALKRAQEDEEKKEGMRLLYVALTRARQYFLATSIDKSGADSYYTILRTALFENAGDSWKEIVPGIFGLQRQKAPEKPEPDLAVPKREEAPVTVPDWRPIPESGVRIVWPSEALSQGIEAGVSGEDDSAAARRQKASLKEVEKARIVGVLVHRGLEQRINSRPWEVAPVLERLVTDSLQQFSSEEISEMAATVTQQIEKAWRMQELQQLLSDATLLRTEMPIQHLTGKQLISGVIDLFIVKDSEGWVVDFKTVPLQEEPAEAMVKQYGFARQLRYYENAVREIFPLSKVNCWILLTEAGVIVTV